jgi:hypothetical protein
MDATTLLINQLKDYFGSEVLADPEFSFADADLINKLTTVAGKDLSSLQPYQYEGVILRTARDIYWKLATINAPLYSIDVEKTKIYKNQRFDHYLALIQQLDVEYSTYISNTPQSTVQQGEIFIDKYNCLTQRNYENTPVPSPIITLDMIYNNKVELSWTRSISSLFYEYLLFLDTSLIFDKYVKQTDYYKRITSSTAKLIFNSYDKSQHQFRIEDLVPGTLYHVLIMERLKNGVMGLNETTFSTPVI